MRGFSDRQQLIRDLFFLYMINYDDEQDAQLTRPKTNHNLNIWADLFLSDLAEISDLLEALLNTRYLNPRPKLTVREEYNLAAVFQMPDYVFKQALRCKTQKVL